MLKWSKRLKKKVIPTTQDNIRQQEDPMTPEDLPILRNVNDNLTRIKDELGNSTDMIIREFQLNTLIRGALVYIDGLADGKMISDFILESIAESSGKEEQEDPFSYVKEKVIALGGVQLITDWNKLFLSLLSGETVILVDGYSKAISGCTRGGQWRSISEPTTQLSIRGPKDAFNESIRTNSALLRRRIKSPNLWLETITLGKVTQTDVGIMYLKGIANEKIVEEVRRRLKRIDIDGVLESGYIEQLIEDQTFTPFPTIYHTERPDVVSSKLLEGRIAILVDGTPFVLTTPAVFIEFFQAVEDYYFRVDISTVIRLLRILTFFISLLAPAVYIAATTFHQEMIPTTMAIAIAAQREGVPFPAFVEAFLMEVTFEILREAGLRLPRAVGQAVSIVGALVIGQAAVQAGLVSPAMVIIVSITAIASFSTPTFAMAISARLIRFILMVMAATFGFYGISLGLVFMSIHLCALRSFGVPYMAPLAPFIISEQQDVFIRFPIWGMKSRPKLIADNNMRRTGENQKPSPKQQKGEQSDGRDQENQTKS